MNKGPNHFVIGVFVLGAIALFISAVVLFGSGALFRESQAYVTFFQGSVKGLRNGGAVLFRGVKIGEVTDVHLQVDHTVESVRIPVIFQIYPDSILEVGERPKEEGRVIRRMIEQGLRAQLELESLVTGILAVNLDFHPDSESVFVGAMPQYTEIPAIPSTLQLISDAFGDLPLAELVDEIRKVVKSAADIISSEEAQAFPKQASKTIEQVRATMKEAKSVLQRIDQQVDPLSEDLQKVLRRSDSALKKIEGTFEELQTMLDENSATRYEARDLMRSIREAADELKELANYIERNPDALLRGR